MARIRITTHPPQPVVQIMTSRVPVVSARATIGEIEKILLKKTRFFDSINYVYVVNQEKVLAGVISIKEIFRRQKDTLVARVMIKNIFSLRPGQSGRGGINRFKKKSQSGASGGPEWLFFGGGFE